MPDWIWTSDDGLSDGVTALIILVGGIFIAWIARRIVRRALEPHIENVVADLLARLLSYLIVALAIVYAMAAVGIEIGPIIGALGIAGIAIAFALQDLLENFVAGLMLQIRRPFAYGDEIASGDVDGVVTAVDARTVTVKTPDGELVQLPSALVIKAPLTNFTTRGARRTSIDIGIAYGTVLSHAITTFTDAVSAVDGVLDDPGPQVLVREFADSSINLVVRFWHEPTNAAAWQVRSSVAVALSEAADRAGIEIPFPQRTVWFRSENADEAAPPA